MNKNGTIWDELPETDVDSTKLEFLFESRAKDALVKEKQQEMNKIKEIVVLDHKRSNGGCYSLFRKVLVLNLDFVLQRLTSRSQNYRHQGQLKSR